MKFSAIINKFIFTISEDDGFVGGVVGDKLKDVGDNVSSQISKGIVDGFTACARALFDFLSPFVEWGTKFTIVCCIVVYFCNSQDKKCISLALKCFFLYLLYMAIASVVV